MSTDALGTEESKPGLHKRIWLFVKKHLSVWKKLWIFIKNGLPLIGTVSIAIVLFSALGTGRRLGRVSLDALKWPGFSSTTTIPTKSPDARPADIDKAEIISKPILEGEAVHHILLVTTFAFIGFNTLIFLIENLNAFACVSKKRLLYLAWFLTLCCEIVTVLWIPKVYEGWDADWICPFPDQVVAFLMFSVFAIVDCLNSRAYEKNAETALNGNKEHDKKLSQWAKNQALLVDLPVIIGIGVSTFMAVHLTQHFEKSPAYLSGFFSGATVMHLAASQIIYTILAIKADLDE